MVGILIKVKTIFLALCVLYVCMPVFINVTPEDNPPTINYSPMTSHCNDPSQMTK